MGKDVRVATEARRIEGGTASKILDVAERLVQLRGFNGFSYADVAEELGISKASLHYHFAGKAELGEALIERYASRFTGSLDEIETRPIDARAKLAAYASLYGDVLRPAPARLEHQPAHLVAADHEDVRVAVRERANLVRGLEPLVCRLLHRCSPFRVAGYLSGGILIY